MGTAMALDRFYGFQLPDELREVATRHQQHVADLVSKLRSSGMEDILIDQAVDQLVASYRAELLEAVKSLRELRHA